MYETILIPTDGSDPATTAARYGLAPAERFGATVHVLPVVDSDRVVTDAVGDVDDLVRHQRALLTDRARDAVEHAATGAPASVEVHTRVVEGRPARMLVAAIDDHDADLVCSAPTVGPASTGICSAVSPSGPCGRRRARCSSSVLRSSGRPVSRSP